MSSSWGDPIHISIFGESHGEGIGVTIDGLPAGEPINWDALSAFCARRAPGHDKTATPRKESDAAEVLSGVYQGYTTGVPLCAVIRNQNTRSGDYSELSYLPRPGHADYTGKLRYKGYNDPRGGGHFSGRLTAPLTFAGGICKQILERRGVFVGAHIFSIASVCDASFDTVNLSPDLLKALSQSRFPLIDEQKEAPMREEVEAARRALDSVGGIVECAAVGMPAGIGSPMFEGVENVLSSILFGIPAIKGVEFGDGFLMASRRGSENNDPYCVCGDTVKTVTNHCGGILGGITTGMPLLLRAVIKPTSSIAQKQQTVDLRTRENAVLSVHGRHDPCIVPRAVPVIEAAVALGLCNLLARGSML